MLKIPPCPFSTPGIVIDRAILLLLLSSLASAQTPLVTTIPYFSDKGSSPIQAVALDPAGNIYIAGTTTVDIPLVNALQPNLGGGNCSTQPGKTSVPCPNVFVAKFDPTGTKLIYSTYLGGDQSDFAAGLAVDPAGNAYIAGTTRPASAFPQPSPYPGGTAFIKKLNATGSALLYTRYIGGDTTAAGIAVDRGGNAYIVGSSFGTAFPSVNPLPTHPQVKSLYVTNDAGRTWESLNNGLTATNINSLAIDPTHPATLFAATSAGLYKSTDAGASWTHLFPTADVGNVVIVDPRHPSTVYLTYTAGYDSYLARSTDAGATWSTISDNFPLPPFQYPQDVTAFAIDPADSNVLWAITIPMRFSTVLKSTGAGDHWQVVYAFPPDIFQSATLVGQKLLIDPRNNSRLYACCIHAPFAPGTGGVYRTDDGGKTWIQGALGPLGGSAGILSPWLDPSDSNVLYGDWYYGLQRSADAGMTWTAMPLPTGLADHGYEPGGFAIDASGTLYLLNDFGYLLRSPDHGATWTKIDGPWLPQASILAIDPTNPSRWYIASGASLSTAGTPPQHAFAAKLDASGAVQWATLLGGSGQDEAHAVAVDSAGNAYVTGQTNSDDFPTVNPFQPTRGHNTFPTTNAFITEISAGGSKLIYSSFLGGTGQDSATSVTVDTAGNAYIGGTTENGVFPTVPSAAQPANPYAASFLAKVDPVGKLLYSRLLTNSTGYPTADQVNSIAIDPQGRVIVAGITGDFNLPLINPVQPTFGLGSSFITRLSPAGDTPGFSTYLGDLHEDLNSLELGSAGSLWIARNTGLARIDFDLPATRPGVPLILSVVNAASYEVSDEVAPGEIVTIIGRELAPAIQTAGTGSLPRTMQDVQVAVGGVSAPLFYVSPTQINFQIPVEFPLGAAPLVVARGTQISNVHSLQIVATSPGLFAAGADVRSTPAVVHASDYSLVTEQNPAHGGEYLSAFCTGLGATDPPVLSGEPATAAASTTTGVIAVFDSGPEMLVSYAGLAPGWIGLYQVNFRVNDTESPGRKQLWIAAYGNPTNQAPIWVQ